MNALPKKNGEDEVEGCTTVAAGNLRSSLQHQGEMLLKTYAALERIEHPLPSSSRARYLVSLERLIPREPSKHWHEEWEELTVALYGMNGKPERGLAWVQSNEALETAIQEQTKNIEYDVVKGWPLDDAITLNLLQMRPAPLVRAIKERDRRFCASIHALTDVILAQAARSLKFGLMPPIYRNLHGIDGLVTNDPLWGNIERPDRNGFRGICALGITKGTCSLDRFDENGFKAYAKNNSAQWELVVQESAVVCFESGDSEDGDHAVHNAVRIHETAAAYPPNTLFRLVRIDEDGFKLPNGLHVKQRLLTVHSSYIPFCTRTTSSEGSKMCSGLLFYAGRDAFVDGLDDIVELPMLTMAQEFDRDLNWIDWKGATYHLREEWEYVNGSAVKCDHCTPGTRDMTNMGKTPDDFRSEINAYIHSCRTARHGIMLMLPEDYAFLSIEEVLAIRLYTGPCYEVLNDFLRQVSRLHGDIRRDVIRSPMRTFAATIGHICTAIRKLAAIMTAEEASRPLFRGIRGELPRGTWATDENGLVCVVDTAFMSTSRNRHTPIHYMGGGGAPNVLWKLQTQRESHIAFHCGADVSMLSQFAAEDEVLFPPCTMLVVCRRDSRDSLDAGASGDVFAQMLATLEVHEEEEDRKMFLAVQAVPHFV